MKKKYVQAAVALILTAAMTIGVTACGGKDAGSEQATESATEATQSLSAKATAWMQNETDVIAEDDNYRTYYEIFVYSFCDSDGDGVGDLNGVRSKLDYIQDMGFTGIWLMPIMESPTYHKYDSTDYMSVDDEYGTLDDFKALVEECHERNIKVIIDLAMNHSSSEHPWFKEAYAYIQSLGENEEPDAEVCPYVDYYNFTKNFESGYTEVSGTDWYYESQFWSGMPDLNWDSQAVRDEFQEIAKFWMDMGIDGFRLDAVKYFYFGDDEGCKEVLSWFNDYVTSLNPNSYIVCENWSDQTAYAKYYESGVDSLFDFKFADKSGVIAQVVKGSSAASSYGKALVAEEELYASYSADYINAPFYTNHDLARSAGYYLGDNSEAQVKIAQAMNLLMSGNPFLYYGEELGMKGSGKDENKRAPMYWSMDADAEGMCDGPADMENFDMKFESYEEQSKDASSIYQYVKNVILLRNQQEVIRKGSTTCLEDLSNDDICVIKKTYEGEELLLLFNISENENTVDLSGVDVNGNAAQSAEIAGELLTGDTEVNISDATVTMPAYSILVLR
ncbi:MAG: alpha-amylase [Lachnospiraceae bacterium]|nr:alpha-amylase [Lachnospiraceae bacterium]